MYGINNINRVMQGSNPNEEHNFGVDIFKVDDPVLFNNCPITLHDLYKVLLNNLININVETEKKNLLIEELREKANLVL